MMNIDQNRLITELYYQRNAFKNGQNDIIKNDLGGYNALNAVLGDCTGYFFPDDGMFFNSKEAQSIFDKHYFKGLDKFVDFASKYEKDYVAMLSSFSDILDEVEFNYINYIQDNRKYSEKDFMDILCGYFSTYGNKVYSIVKKYIEENRIQIGCDSSLFDERETGGFFAKLVYMNSGYIVLLYDKLDSRALSFLAHELGHAIDAEMFH